MSIEIRPEMLKEIAGYLDGGMLCFYNKNNGKLETYPDELEFSGYENDWADVVNKIEAHRDDYFQIEKMSSREVFEVMENFINGINDRRTYSKFINAISYKKPFAHFKDLLSYYPTLRQEWFAFKLENDIEFIKRQFESDLAETEPFDEFLVHLEYHLSRTFQNSSDKKLRWFGCDGVCTPTDTQLSLQNITTAKKIETQAWMEINGQAKYDMIIRLGPDAIKAYTAAESLIYCLPSEDSLDWVTLDIEKKTIELQLK